MLQKARWMDSAVKLRGKAAQQTVIQQWVTTPYTIIMKEWSKIGSRS